MGEIWAIVLAAGESKRMGSPKMLLDFGGKTMIENVIANIAGSKVNKIMVVTGAYRDALIEKIGGSGIRYCYNDNYKEGMLSSVQCGFRNVPLHSEAVIVFQGDQPFIRAETIDLVIEAYRSSYKGIIVPVYDKRRGHPILIDKRYRNEIEKLNAHIGLRSLTYNFSEDVLEVETDDPGILRDFDTYKDYSNEINKIR